MTKTLCAVTALSAALMAQETTCSETVPNLPIDCVEPAHPIDPTCPTGTRLRHDETTNTLWCCPTEVQFP
jgi:hypothetical protein